MLYNLGARKIVVFGLGQIGCTPAEIARFGTNAKPSGSMMQLNYLMASLSPLLMSSTIFILMQDTLSSTLLVFQHHKEVYITSKALQIWFYLQIVYYIVLMFFIWKNVFILQIYRYRMSLVVCYAKMGNAFRTQALVLFGRCLFFMTVFILLKLQTRL